MTVELTDKRRDEGGGGEICSGFDEVHGMNRMNRGDGVGNIIFFALAVRYWKLITLRERKSGSRIPWKYWPLKFEPRERVVYSSNVNHITRLLNPKWKMFTELQSYKVAVFFSPGEKLQYWHREILTAIVGQSCSTKRNIISRTAIRVCRV